MSAMELRRDSGGLRHYLDGAPVHCGDEIEVRLPGQDGWTPVRYEARLIEPVSVTLYGVDVVRLDQRELELFDWRWIVHPDARGRPLPWWDRP